MEMFESYLTVNANISNMFIIHVGHQQNGLRSSTIATHVQHGNSRFTIHCVLTADRLIGTRCPNQRTSQSKVTVFVNETKLHVCVMLLDLF